MTKNVKLKGYVINNKIIYRPNKSDVNVSRLIQCAIVEFKKLHWIQAFRAYYKACLIVNNGKIDISKGVKWPENVVAYTNK